MKLFLIHPKMLLADFLQILTHIMCKILFDQLFNFCLKKL